MHSSYIKNTETSHSAHKQCRFHNIGMYVIVLYCNMSTEIPLIILYTPFAMWPLLLPSPWDSIPACLEAGWLWPLQCCRGNPVLFPDWVSRGLTAPVFALRTWDLHPERWHDLVSLKIKCCLRMRFSCPSRAKPQPTLRVNAATWRSKTSWRMVQPIYRNVPSDKSSLFAAPKLYLLVCVCLRVRRGVGSVEAVIHHWANDHECIVLSAINKWLQTTAWSLKAIYSTSFMAPYHE